MSGAPLFTHGYVAIAECVCVVGLCADLHDRETAKTVAGYIATGHTVERMSLEAAVAALQGERCAEHQATLEQRKRARVRQAQLFGQEACP